MAHARESVKRKEKPGRPFGPLHFIGGFIMKLEEIKTAIEGLTEEEKKEFFSEIVPEICDETVTKEGCRMIFEKKLSGSRYLDAFDELHEMQKDKD
jgi:hypothetical protein